MSSNRLEKHKEDDSNSPSKPSESTLGHFGHTIAQEVEDATAKWMKMISSTFLGETSTSTYFSSRKSLTSGTRDVDEDEEVQEEKKNQVKRTIQLKIALVGGTGVGKTTILRRWLERPYQSKYNTTIGVDVCSFMYKYKNKKEIQLDIWDVSSVEIDNQSSLHTLLCDQLDGIFFVFNVHRVSSIAAIDKWRQALSKYISAKEIPFFLLSHKADLLQKRVMTSDDIAAYARVRISFWTTYFHQLFEVRVRCICRPQDIKDGCGQLVVQALETMINILLYKKHLTEW
jgi:small GTP-binding protein